MAIVRPSARPHCRPRPRLLSAVQLVVVVGAIAAGVAACSPEKLGRGVSKGATSELGRFLAEPGVRASLDSLAASAVQGAGRALEDSLLPRLDGALARASQRADSLMLGMRGRLQDIQHDLADTLRGPLRGATAALAREVIDTSGRQLRAQLDSTFAGIGQQMTGAFRDSLLSGLQVVTDSLVSWLARGFRDDIAPAAGKAIRETIRGADKELQGSQTMRRLLWVLGAIAGTTALGAVARIAQDRRRSRRALEVVTNEIDRAQLDDLKDRIQMRARDANVESWLHGFLEKRKTY